MPSPLSKNYFELLQHRQEAIQTHQTMKEFAKRLKFYLTKMSESPVYANTFSDEEKANFISMGKKADGVME